MDHSKFWAEMALQAPVGTLWKNPQVLHKNSIVTRNAPGICLHLYMATRYDRDLFRKGISGFTTSGTLKSQVSWLFNPQKPKCQNVEMVSLTVNPWPNLGLCDHLPHDNSPIPKALHVLWLRDFWSKRSNSLSLGLSKCRILKWLNVWPHPHSEGTFFFATLGHWIPSTPSPSHRDGRNAKSKTSKMSNSFKVPSPRHNAFHDFGVSKTKQPTSLSLEISESQTLNYQNVWP